MKSLSLRGAGASISSRAAMRWFVAALLLMLAMFVWLGWVIYDVNHIITRITRASVRLQQLEGNIRLLDETLTMSARMNAATDDRRWEARYLQHEPQLDAALKEALHLAPATEAARFAAQTDAANVKLVELEKRSFALARAGNPSAAHKLLSNQEYETYKTIYADGMNRFLNTVSAQMDAELRREQTRATWSVIFGATILGIALTAWLAATRAVQRSRRQLIATLNERDRILADNERLALVAQKTQNAVVITDSDCKIVWVNEGFTRITEYTLEEVVNRKPGAILQGAQTDAETVADIRKAINARVPFESEIYNYSKSGRGYWLSISITPIFNNDETLRGFIAIEMDITERKRMEAELKSLNTELEARVTERTTQLQIANDQLQDVNEQLRHNAFHDALTSLPNRALFAEHLRKAIAGNKRLLTSSFAVLFIDLDRFKIVNDSLGHVVGDKLLIKIAERLRASVRPGDTVARLGGDEFVILLEGLHGEHEAVCIAERIQQEVSRALTIDNHEVYTTVSIGIALGNKDYNQPNEILRDADAAMYRAKQAGKARYEIFDTAMHAHAAEMLQLEVDLRHALTRGELRLQYQPIVYLNDSSLRGFEALLRWHHPMHGVISPAKFIPLAEESSLILPIGEWVLREACLQLARWQTEFPNHPPLSISVNLSGKQFMQSDVIATVKRLLEETQINPADLRLEITESVVMEQSDAAAKLERLRLLGVKISIDDFGTGYSSLSYLHRFPVSTLKIDRSFINRMETETEGTEIVKTVVALARNLGLEVVAEGVETDKQLRQLQLLNCAYGQGYLFAKPLTATDARALIAAEHEAIHTATIAA